MRIEPLGDSALLLELTERGASEAALDDVLSVARVLQEADIPGVVEITSAFTTVAIFYDPTRVSSDGASIFTSLEALIHSALAEPSSVPAVADAQAPTIAIPVCYDPEFAVDLADVARHAALTEDEVIRLHVSAEYRVACVGFTPGFPYLVGLPAELATPRRATPRMAVPAGSVAIGGSQAGIYPLQSPGGWNVIGRTPLRLFDVERETPSLLRAGDRVRFCQITREQFAHEWSRRAATPEEQ